MVPAAVGLALVAPEVVLVFLGANWVAAIPLIQIIAIGKAGVALTSSGRQVLLATGRVRINAVFTWIQTTTFAVLALTLFHGSDAEQISYLRLFVGVSGVGVLFVLLFRVLPYLGPLDVLKKSIRPVLAALLMAAVLLNWPFGEDLSNWVVLFSKVALGAGVYVGAIGLLLVLAGKPSGAEVYVSDKIRSILRVKS